MARTSRKPPPAPDNKQQHVDLCIGLVLIGEKGREQLACYLRKRQERAQEGHCLRDAS
jgi:hypothetical protein